MTSTLSWEIKSLTKSNQPIDGADDVVIRVEYSRVCKDGDAVARDARALEFDPSDLKGPFDPLANLTEADVIGWIEAHEATLLIDENDINAGAQLDVVDAALTEQVAAMVAPVAEPVDLPWAKAS